MRTLGDICEMVHSGGRPEYDELRYALQAMQQVMVFDRMAFIKLAEAEREGKKPILVRSAQWQWEEFFRRYKTALEKSPKEWLGPDNDPDSAEVQKRRAVAIKIYERAASTVSEVPK